MEKELIIFLRMRGVEINQRDLSLMKMRYPVGRILLSSRNVSSVKATIKARGGHGITTGTILQLLREQYMYFYSLDNQYISQHEAGIKVSLMNRDAINSQLQKMKMNRKLNKLILNQERNPTSANKQKLTRPVQFRRF